MKIPFTSWMNILKFMKVKYLHMIWLDIWNFFGNRVPFFIYQPVL
jgi:hypothetical protein